MTKRDKSGVLIANLGHHAIVFNEDDVVRMLRVAVEREGGQSAFASATASITLASIGFCMETTREWLLAKALGLRKVYVAE